MRKLRNIKRILISFLLILSVITPMPVQKAEAKSKINSKSAAVTTYDEFWTQFYKLVGDGYNEITLSIKGDDAVKIKNEIDEDKGWPFFTDSIYAKKYMNKASWKAKYFLDFFTYKYFYKFDPNEQDYIEENYYFEDEIIYKNGYFDISNLDKKMYTKWNGEYYLNFDYEYKWDIELYSAEYEKYMWSEENQELCITLELETKYDTDDYTYDHDNVLKTFREVQKLLKSWRLENMTDYQRISKVNQYICDHVSYNANADLNPGRGSNAFLFGEAICNGYAELTEIFLKTMGYETVLITAESVDYEFDNDGHAWNIVKLDKKWYAIDTTWNDASKDKTKYLLVSQTEMKDHNPKRWIIGNVKDYTLSTKRLSKDRKAKIKLAY
jgi:transglutaminase-like putative cysteine protease